MIETTIPNGKLIYQRIGTEFHRLMNERQPRDKPDLLMGEIRDDKECKSLNKPDEIKNTHIIILQVGYM